MFDTHRIQEDFSRAARHYDEHAHLQQRVLVALLERTRPFISKNTRLLDAGCGTGRLAQELKRNDIIQLDIAYEMCRRAGDHAVNADIMHLPFSDASFDVVFSSLALQWLPAWKEGMKELRRVLKPGGVLAVSTLGENTLYELRGSFTACDHFPHVSPFILPDNGWQRDHIVEHFSDLKALMQALKTIGAGNKLTTRRKALMTPGRLKAVENFYRKHFSDASGLRASWEVLYLVEQAGAL